MSEERLLPCPFCGSEAVGLHGWVGIGYSIWCPGCEHEYFSTTSEQKVVKLWNHRAQPASNDRAESQNVGSQFSENIGGSCIKPPTCAPVSLSVTQRQSLSPEEAK